jgi:hypothetical protein
VTVKTADAPAQTAWFAGREAEGAAGLICSSTVEELLAGTGSGSLAVTVARLAISPVADGVTVIVAVAAVPEAIAPRLHVTDPPAGLQLPWVAPAETKETPAGRVSVS